MCILPGIFTIPGKKYDAARYLLEAANRGYDLSTQVGERLLGESSRMDLYVDDAAALALSMEPKLAFENIHASNALSRILQRYGGAQSTDELVKFLDGTLPDVLKFRFSHQADGKQSIMIHFGKYDWLSALYIANRVAFLLGYFPVLRLIRADVSLHESLSVEVKGHVVVGAPDSPGEIGAFVAGLDADISGLYQARLDKDFSMPIPIKKLISPGVVLMASGLGEIAEAWDKACADQERFPFLKKDKEHVLMPIDITTTVLVHVLKSVSGKVAKGLTSELGRLIKERLKQSPRSADSLSATLSRLGSTLGRTSDDASLNIHDVIEDLETPVRRELLELSDASGVLQIEQARIEALIESGVGIEPQDFHDSFGVLILMCDQITQNPDLREIYRRDIETHRTRLRTQQRKAHDLQTRLRVGDTVDGEIADLETQVHRSLTSLRNLIADSEN